MVHYPLRVACKRQAGACLLALLGLAGTATAQTHVLFVGDSFTHGKYAPVRNYNAAAVTDENYGLPATSPRYESMASEPGPWGGIPGIFKKFTDEAGLSYNVHLEAISAKSLQYHYDNALAVIAQPTWQKVVLQELSTKPLPTSRGGDRAAFYSAVTSLEQAIHAVNPTAQVYLYQTWARADLTYPAGAPYAGLPVDSMTQDLHRGYAQAATLDGRIEAVAPAGEAWLQAIAAGLAERNPANSTCGPATTCTPVPGVAISMPACYSTSSLVPTRARWGPASRPPQTWASHPQRPWPCNRWPTSRWRPWRSPLRRRKSG
jgi:hypothetical protein